MSQMIGNRYQIIKLIGKGGMADVYLALDSILNREVAVKVLRNELAEDSVAIERFAREANAATKLSHPNIVDIYDVGQDGDKHYIVMEYIRGVTLKDLLRRRGPIPFKESVWIMKQLSSALMEAHKNGIIHRDIKSQNIMIKDDGTVKIADFGIALAKGISNITSENSVVGSVHYLAPELSQGEQATMQSDIYSLGIVFYELITGKVPYEGDTAVQIAVLHVRNDVPSIRELDNSIPQSVENIIIKATARNLDERYPNAALLLRDLNDCLKEEHLNDKKYVLSSPVNKKSEEEKKEVVNNKNKEEANKKKRLIATLTLSLIGILSLACVLIILFICGFIGNNSKYSKVPDISNLSVVEASDLLDENYLSLDLASIKRVMTDDIEAGLIISFSPEADTKVERGTKVTVVVSDGKYQKIDNYIGRNIDEVTALLKEMNFIVEAVAIESDEPSGTIITQNGFVAGDKYNPNISNTINFEYSEYLSIIIPFGTKGRNVGEVAEELEKAGFTVAREILKEEDLTEEEKSRYQSGQVIRISPEEGMLFKSVDEESKITIYYY